MDFKYPKNIDEFDDLLEHFQRHKAHCDEKFLGENIKLDRLIIMDDVSGLANKSETFANFLTVSRKFGLKCVYAFHTIYAARQKWQMIFAQRKIFNIFSGSIQTSSIVKTLLYFCGQYKYNYVPNRDPCINRLYFNISNSTKK